MLITSLADTFLQFDSSQIIANFPFRMRHTGPVVPKCLNTQGTKSNTPLGTPHFSSDNLSCFLLHGTAKGLNCTVQSSCWTEAGYYTTFWIKRVFEFDISVTVYRIYK